MDKETDMTETKRQIEVMKAYEEGKTIQYRGKCTKDDVWNDTKFPSWNWYSVDYRIKPEEPEEPKKLMTNRQLAELMVKGYGEWSFNTEELDFHTEVGYGLLNTDKEVDGDILIRPWESKELRKPTVDIYEEYVSKWNRAFSWANAVPKGENKSEPRPQDCPQSSGIKDYSDCGSVEPKIGEVFRYNGLTLRCEEGSGCVGCALVALPCCGFECRKLSRKDGKGVHFVDISEKENTTASEESSSTERECGGVHKRTPQEIADFFNCYVAMDKDGLWYLYEGKPMVCEGRWKVGDTGDCRCLGYSGKFFLDIPQSSNWRTLYRPHKEPIVMEDEND